MVFIKMYPRPMGPEPKIYHERPSEPITDSVEIEPGLYIEDPWSIYDIIEFTNELDARRWMKTFYPLSYQELKKSFKY